VVRSLANRRSGRAAKIGQHTAGTYFQIWRLTSLTSRRAGSKALGINTLKNCCQFYRLYPDIHPSLGSTGYPSRSLRLSHRHGVLSEGLRKDLSVALGPRRTGGSTLGFFLYGAKTKR
jgi:hypothetical protein